MHCSLTLVEPKEDCLKKLFKTVYYYYYYYYYSTFSFCLGLTGLFSIVTAG